MSWLNEVEVLLYFMAGGALGMFYFVLLLQTVRMHAAQEMAIQIIPLYIIRLVVAIPVFWLIAQQGAAALLFALLGFLVARFVVQYWSGGEQRCR